MRWPNGHRRGLHVSRPCHGHRRQLRAYKPVTRQTGVKSCHQADHLPMLRRLEPRHARLWTLRAEPLHGQQTAGLDDPLLPCHAKESGKALTFYWRGRLRGRFQSLLG